MTILELAAALTLAGVITITYTLIVVRVVTKRMWAQSRETWDRAYRKAEKQVMRQVMPMIREGAGNISSRADKPIKGVDY